MPPSPADDPRLAALIDAALAGALAAMAIYATDFSVEAKADGSPVGRADREAEAAIVGALSSAMPDVPVVAEEAVAAGHIPEIGQEFLLVDPLDGTKEFISRNGEFTVNIALIKDGAPMLGVVLAPAIGLAYAGGPGGAWKGALTRDFGNVDEWSAIRTGAAGLAPVAVASRSHSNPPTDAALADAGCVKRRSMGSSLKFCLVAEGSADFYPRLGPTMGWDTAAGDAILRAAGGMVVTLDGKPLRYGKQSLRGGRDFENPHFLALGDRSLLKRLDLRRFGAGRAA